MRTYHGFVVINKKDKIVLATFLGYSKSLIEELYTVDWIKKGMTAEEASKLFDELYIIKRIPVYTNLEDLK